MPRNTEAVPVRAMTMPIFLSGDSLASDRVGEKKKKKEEEEEEEETKTKIRIRKEINRTLVVFI
ncbi:hypothetical protein FACS1894187_23010 [Synergistales bacterium]|nr:hypothetical protein FACS1894187_23010 [Synergistales bacterium]